MFFPDKIKGYSEARRVLKPGGRFLFNVWDKIEENDFPKVVQQRLRQIFPNEPPQFPVPHARMAITTSVEFGPIWRQRVSAILRSKRSHIAAVRVRRMIQRSLSVRARRCAPKSKPAMDQALKTVTQQVAEALARRFGNGAIEGRIQAFVISAVA